MYPVSAIVLIPIVIVFIILSTINISLLIFVFILIYTDCISLKPLVNIIFSYIEYFFKDTLDRAKKNINESFAVEGECERDLAIYVFHPHSIFAVSQLLHTGTTITDWPDKNTKAVSHSYIFNIPLVKDFVNSMCISSEYSIMKDTLKRGSSISVSLGGMSESEYLNENTLTFIVKKRKGIFKMALETGVPLIPVITYGETNIFKNGKYRFIEYINSILGIHLSLPTLQSLYNWFIIYKRPLDTKIETYIGEPVDVEQIENPSKRDIREVRKRYIQALRELYTKTHPPQYTELQII
jgi:hypothetical protein